MTPEQARTELEKWAANDARRDPLVVAAKAAGLEKKEIHIISGIARTTIDRVLKRANSQTLDPVSATISDAL